MRNNISQSNRFSRIFLLSVILVTQIIQTFSQEKFYDDFEKGLQNWAITDSSLCQLYQSNDTVCKFVLRLVPNNTANCVLIKKSENWKGILIEGKVLFPTNQECYLGLVYNYISKNGRNDFDCIYVKGNSSYIQVNPHFDGNASRLLYEDYKTKLEESNKFNINEWISFKAEIIGRECQVYVKDMNRPLIRFKDYEWSHGMIGFEPRFAGGECWLDKIKVSEINKFSFAGKIQPENSIYYKDSLLTDWKVIGPFNKRVNEIENSLAINSFKINGIDYNWQNFEADERGCIIAGKICRYTTDEKYVYYSSSINEKDNTIKKIQFSSLNNLYVWINSRYVGKVEKQAFAWFDFFRNSEHNGNILNLELQKGENNILILVEGGNYGGDGFYSYIDTK